MHDMLRMLKSQGGSDLYLNSGAAPTIRIYGKMVAMAEQKLTAGHTQIFARSLMNDKQSAEFEATNESNFAIDLPGVSRFRINAYVQRGCVAIVARLIINDIPSFERL